MKYSPLPPSSAARRVACPGSKYLEESYRSDERSPSAFEGEAAHWLAMSLLTPSPVLHATSPTGEILTQEMYEGAKLWQETVLDTAPSSSQLHIEERLDISFIHPDCWGVPDCWFYDKAQNRLYIFEYKYGRKAIEVFENWQMLEYAAGILAGHVITEVSAEVFSSIEVFFVIVQPRAHHNYLGKVREWSVPVNSLDPYFKVLRETEAEASSDKAMCRPSPECNYCAARHVCRALRTTALTITDSSELNIPRPLRGEELGTELRYLQRSAKLLNARITGLEAEAEIRLKKGEVVTNYRLQEGQGKEVWDAPLEEVKGLGELFGVDLTKEDLITPKQAIKAGIPDAEVRQYSKTYGGSLKLTPVDEGKSKWIFGGNK